MYGDQDVHNSIKNFTRKMNRDVHKLQKALQSFSYILIQRIKKKKKTRLFLKNLKMLNISPPPNF